MNIGRNKNFKKKNSKAKHSSSLNDSVDSKNVVNIDSKKEISEPIKEVKPEENLNVSSNIKGVNNKPQKRGTSFFKSKKSRNLFIAGVVAVIVAIFCVVGAFAYSILNTSFDDEDSIKAKGELTPSTFEEPFYMLLVGTDTREGESYSLEDGRSDSCMLVRIDPNNYIVTLVSIPRDSMIQWNGQTQKFNAVYAAEGIAGSIAAVKQICNVEIAHYAEISFNGLVDMVNAVGGVEVDVPEEINDPEAGPEAVPKGKNNLNGNQALAFARSRHFFTDGDFSRTADQRILLEALINKAYKMPMSDIPGLLRAAKNFVKTDLKLGDMIGLASQFKDAEKLTIYSAMLPSTTATIDGASYVILYKDGVQRMMKMVNNGEDPSLVEVPDGVATGSSRNAEETKKKQQEYYTAHPDSPGKMTNNSPPVNSYDSYQGQSNNFNQNNNSGYYNDYSTDYNDSY